MQQTLAIAKTENKKEERAIERERTLTGLKIRFYHEILIKNLSKVNRCQQRSFRDLIHCFLKN